MSNHRPSLVNEWLPHPPSPRTSTRVQHKARSDFFNQGGGDKIAPRSDNQAAYIRAMETHRLVLADGPAGTGKTYLAAALAVRALKSGVVEKIIMSRPALEAGERLGFLPGDMHDKINPYLRPLYDALGKVIGDEETNKAVREGLIEIAPLAFMRGRSLMRAFVILDEAQNCTQAQMKMFLTRLGQDSIFVICGDSAQSDLPDRTQAGFPHALKILSSLPSVAVVGLEKEDIQRSPLVADIVAAYEKDKSDEPR